MLAAVRARHWGDEVGFTQKVKLLQCINGVEIVLYEASATRERP
jgi:hypothetical protein